ncbi:PfkB family carbohydrate kinase [Herbiconiux sp. KACC 21604]|uniref:carbohydrate kinase family protein n=1 Tax=unclassified Herbiconiux TaxID=2618217 RepID=UPI00149239A4|nr:PfkB family carbohydrate kinase [Herbiconiux sp. SALV-R1]QJU53747.1 ribokinase [Herbiconiux sp. SALV-R1]WPO84751.1 PfkB family carbohydrate kinase [Herbiconiux sp. KACC 21604]
MPAASAAPIVVVGDVFDDLIVTPLGEVRPDTDTTASIERRDGGSAANAAAWFAASGHPVHFFGTVNRVDVPRHAAALAEAGVTAELAPSELPTGTIVVILQDERTRTMLTERGANAVTSAAQVDRALVVEGAHLHLTGYTLFNGADQAALDREVGEFASLIGCAGAARASVSVNPGSAGFLLDHGVDALLEATAGATVVLPNLDEGRVLTGEEEPERIVAALLDRYEIVALTQGRHGVLAAARSGARAEVPAILVDPVDTTGAGDAFGAAFVSTLLGDGTRRLAGRALDESELRAAAEAGVTASSRAVTRLGARPPAAATQAGAAR